MSPHAETAPAHQKLGYLVIIGILYSLVLAGFGLSVLLTKLHGLDIQAMESAGAACAKMCSMLLGRSGSAPTARESLSKQFAAFHSDLSLRIRDLRK